MSVSLTVHITYVCVMQATQKKSEGGVNPCSFMVNNPIEKYKQTYV